MKKTVLIGMLSLITMATTAYAKDYSDLVPELLKASAMTFKEDPVIQVLDLEFEAYSDSALNVTIPKSLEKESKVFLTALNESFSQPIQEVTCSSDNPVSTIKVNIYSSNNKVLSTKTVSNSICDHLTLKNVELALFTAASPKLKEKFKDAYLTKIKAGFEGDATSSEFASHQFQVDLDKQQLVQNITVNLPAYGDAEIIKELAVQHKKLYTPVKTSNKDCVNYQEDKALYDIVSKLHILKANYVVKYISGSESIEFKITDKICIKT